MCVVIGPCQQRLLIDLVCDAFDSTLLPNISAPTVFNMLRPIAVLLVSAKLWGMCKFHSLGAYGVDCSPSHMGFRKARSCMELVATMRLVLDR